MKLAVHYFDLKIFNIDYLFYIAYLLPGFESEYC